MISMPTTHQPKYSQSAHKFMARELNRRFYILFTGSACIPKERQYITLANDQDCSPTSEINQYTLSKLITKSQFVGIDNDSNYIKKNKKRHPEAKFIHGDWNAKIRSGLNPGMIYLDSTYFADKKPALDALKTTMSICNEETLLICNVMETNPRSGLGLNLDAQALISGLFHNQIPEAFIDWNRNTESPTIEENENSIMNIFSYVYRTTGKTKMRSFLFYKGLLPPEHIIKNEFEEFDLWCKKEFDHILNIERTL